MEVTYNDTKIEIDTESEPGYNEFDFIKVINDYDFEDTLVVNDNKDNNLVDGQSGEEDGK